jgi:hypothetical protein
MTPQEHELIARMFARQMEYTKTLIEIIRSRGIAQDDDYKAFVSLVREGGPYSERALRASKAEYRKTATDIGLKVSFPKLSRAPIA